LEVSQAISNAQSIEEMLEQVVRLTPLLAGLERCAALLRDVESNDFVAVSTYHGPGSQPKGLDALRLAAGDLPLLDLVVGARRLHRVDDAWQSELVTAAWQETVGSKTLVIAPLVVQDEVRGALLVDDVTMAHIVSQRHEDIVNGIARQVSLALQNFQFQAQEEAHIRLAQELQVAQRIQASLLPEGTPEIDGYDLAHAWAAAREVGGDFYDFMRLRGDRLGLLMADVADKGVPAALFMATTSTLLRISAQDHETPDGALLHANGWITASNREDMFVTVWYGILDPTSHCVTFANAGHSLALHVRFVDGAIRQLRPSGVPLGVVENPPIERDNVTLEPGDLLVLYTDGVVDAIDDSKEEFGQARLEQVLVDTRDETAQGVIDAVLAAVLGHTRAAPVLDDMTLWVLKRAI
jgi:serine phosphatase RsbU (regulator of sigma subunit)